MGWIINININLIFLLTDFSILLFVWWEHAHDEIRIEFWDRHRMVWCSLPDFSIFLEILPLENFKRPPIFLSANRMLSSRSHFNNYYIVLLGNECWGAEWTERQKVPKHSPSGRGRARADRQILPGMKNFQLNFHVGLTRSKPKGA